MEFLIVEWLGKPAWMWLGFLAIVGVLLSFEKFPAAWSLGATFAILSAGIAYSLWRIRAALNNNLKGAS